MTPGEAARQAQALLRHNGYTTTTVTAGQDGDNIQLRGTVIRLTDPLTKTGAAFKGVADENGIELFSGVFGRIAEDGKDVFHDL